MSELLDSLNTWLNSNQWFGVYVLPILIWKCIWGYATRAVIKGKGYKADWFLRGVLFGLIAFIVAICKPNVVNTPEFVKQLNQWQDSADTTKQRIKKENGEIKSNVDRLREYKQLLDEGVITQEEFEQKKAQILQMAEK